MLSKHLEQVIKSRIPGLQSQISKTITELEQELSWLGRPFATNAGGKLYMIMEIYRGFDQIFKEHLDGTYSFRYYTVHTIMKDLVQKSIGETTELKLYPSLRVEINHAAIDSLDRMRDESRRATLQLVEMECHYLTVEFFRKFPQDIEKGGNPTHSIFNRYNDSYLRCVGSNVLSYMNMVCASLRNSIPKSVVYCQVREAKRSLLGHFFAELGKKETKQLSTLLDEDPTVMQRRVSLGKRLELYRSAQEEIDAVAWSK